MALMSNKNIAETIREIGEHLAMKNVPFKPRAYEKAAGVIAGLEDEVSDIYKKGGRKALEDIPGVGISIAEKIEELVKTGHVKYLEGLERKTPVDLEGLSRIEGLGPKSIKTLYQKLDIRTVSELEAAAKSGKIAKLEGFGAKKEENILKGIGFAKSAGGRFVLGFEMAEIREIEKRLQAQKNVLRVTVAGSARRRKETIGDVDILVVSKNAEPVMDFFTTMPEVVNVIAHGGTKSSVKLRSGINVDVRVVPVASYGAALNYFTGSKDHNVALRRIAITKGWKLNEYGLFEGERRMKKGEGDGKMIAGKTEEEIYKMFRMDYIEPELRENTGEIERAQKHALPKLVGYGDLRGDLQVQTNWTDGSDSIESMAEAAALRGLEYIAITDHTKRLAMTHGLDEKRIIEQIAEIDRLNKKLRGKITLLKGSECDILKDGTLDLPDKVLAKLDIVGVSVHSYFNLPRAEQTERIKRAMANPHVDILFHPTGRIIDRRPAYDVDMDELVAAAKHTGTIMEIDAFPDRLDLKDEHIRLCVEAGVRMSIDSDAHSPTHFPYLEYGIAQARRGWATKTDIINAWPLEKMLKFLKK
ncbi:MAG: DNA polymerase/3'-5' exonuclease PolX [Minisyncoccia bacterium]